MRKRLYVKLVISFIIVLVLVQLVLFGVASTIVDTGRRHERGRMIAAQGHLLRSYIELRLNSPRGEDEAGLRSVAREMADRFQARVLIFKRDDRVNQWMRQLPVREYDEIQMLSPHLALVDEQPAGDTVELEADAEVHARRWPGFLILDFDRDRVGVALEIDGKSDAYVMVAVLAFAPPIESAGYIFLFGFILAFVLLFFPISRFVLRPLRSLQQTALAFARGDYKARADVKTRDEIGELSQAFNTMAERIDRQITSMRETNAHVSHELRSPLARIRLAEEMLRDTGLASPHLNTIRTEVAHIDDLVGQVLTLSRLEARPSEQLDRIVIEELIQAVVDRIQPMAETRGVNIQMEVDGSLDLRGDERGWESLVSNLLTNAVKFSPDGESVKIHLSHKALFISNECTEEDLRDLDLARVFQPFYHASRPASGTGLGLAIVERIAKNSGATVKARVIGKTFQIELAFRE